MESLRLRIFLFEMNLIPDTAFTLPVSPIRSSRAICDEDMAAIRIALSFRTCPAKPSGGISPFRAMKSSLTCPLSSCQEDNTLMTRLQLSFIPVISKPAAKAGL